MPRIKRALISVSDKRGIVDFARGLKNLGIEIVSTGGTARVLEEAGIPVKEVSQYTGSPALLEGRVKTLHPKVHAGLLALRDNPEHMQEMKKRNIGLIDMVVVNFYPFFQVIQRKKLSLKEALENIDIGGPSMLRSAAKNFSQVAAVSNPDQYTQILKELEEKSGFLNEDTCLNLAMRVFQETSTYDNFITHYLRRKKGEKFPCILNLSFEKKKELRYGENPHQRAAFYREWIGEKGSLSFSQKLSGKKLSFNNFLDLDAALEIVKEFEEPAVVVIKHTNPCGAGCDPNLLEAFKKAWSGDSLSAFGSIVGLNKMVDASTAEEMASRRFIEGIIAPHYEKEALKVLKTKPRWGKNVRILKLGSFPAPREDEWDMKRVGGGLLLQERDKKTYYPHQLKIVTSRKPTSEERDELLFAWIICKHVKSNAIVLSRDRTLVGVGAGQMSRVDSCLIAIKKAGHRARGACLASDAFLPFPDVVEEAGKAGITVIIQPGGSIQDKEIIKIAHKYGMAMLFTGIRHLKH